MSEGHSFGAYFYINSIVDGLHSETAEQKNAEQCHGAIATYRPPNESGVPLFMIFDCTPLLLPPLFPAAPLPPPNIRVGPFRAYSYLKQNPSLANPAHLLL